MKCPECTGEVWATFICDDGRYRCWQCKATGKGRIIVRPKFVVTPDTEKIERPYINRRKK